MRMKSLEENQVNVVKDEKASTHQAVLPISRIRASKILHDAITADEPNSVGII
jgi:hypothetical protein